VARGEARREEPRLPFVLLPRPGARPDSLVQKSGQQATRARSRQLRLAVHHFGCTVQHSLHSQGRGLSEGQGSSHGHRVLHASASPRSALQ
jgi:hypothetical protein